MSRKDYEKAAALVRRLSRDPHVPSITVIEVMAVLADLFEADNPRFDRERFIEACVKTEVSV